MSPANSTKLIDHARVEDGERAIRELIAAQSEWFISEDGRAPFEVNNSEIDFSRAHHRLIFSYWNEKGARTWRVTSWNWTGEKLVFEASRRMGAEVATIELVPRTSAKAIVASISAARQARCEQLAQVVSEHIAGAKIERAALSPGMRRDQPGRYARIVVRAPHERAAVTATVAQSDTRNADSLFSSALLWFNRLLASPKRPAIHRLLLVVERNILEAARQRHVLLRHSLRHRIELFEIDEDWRAIEPARPFERKNLWRKRLNRFPPLADDRSSDRVPEIIATAPHAIDVLAS